jgi:uncharacterized protein (TIGR03435 family)
MTSMPLSLLIIAALVAVGSAQEFETAAVRTAAPSTDSHWASASDSPSGGPGTSDPGMFRCASCTLSSLILKAFQLQKYQLQGQALPGNAFEVSAKVPNGTTQEQFLAMLQNLLKERFALAWHFEEKSMRGYHLRIARGGPKLKESAAEMPQHSSGERHTHSGAITFGGQARYQGNGKTIGDLVNMISDQLGLPVDDQTGLTGKYDIALTWASDNASQSAAGHADGGRFGDHDHGSADSASTLFQALQSQLGLRLVAADKSTARILVIDRVEKSARPN